MTARREKAKLDKKNKKKRKMEEEDCQPSSSIGAGAATFSSDAAPPVKMEKTIADALKEMRRAADGEEDIPTTSKTDKSRKDKDKSIKDKKDKSRGGDKGSSSSSSETGKKSSVQDDPTKSEIYKSLFTSHKDAVNQPKAHWVTMNPGYFR